MRAFDHGATYSVSITAAEVRAFAATWPCSGLRDRGLTFTFDKRAGNLVNSNDDYRHPKADGAALVALSTDAMCYGAKRLKLADVLAIRAREVRNYDDMMQRRA